MPELTADMAAIEGLAARVHSASADIEAQLTRLERALDTLSGQWNGEARQAYATAQTKWLAAMRTLSDIADAASDGTEQWAGRLRQLERECATGWPV